MFKEGTNFSWSPLDEVSSFKRLKPLLLCISLKLSISPEASADTFNFLSFMSGMSADLCDPPRCPQSSYFCGLLYVLCDGFPDASVSSLVVTLASAGAQTVFSLQLLLHQTHTKTDALTHFAHMHTPTWTIFHSWLYLLKYLDQHVIWCVYVYYFVITHRSLWAAIFLEKFCCFSWRPWNCSFYI